MDSDQKLVADHLKGDEKALEILIHRYLKPIFSFVYKYVGNSQDAEDITQDVFVRVWRNLKKFDKNKKFKTWIFTIAKNTCIDFFRKRKTIPFSNFSACGARLPDGQGSALGGENIFIETLADPSPLPDEISELAGFKDIISRTMKKLALKYQTILLLYYGNNFTFREIAESTGESLNTIKSRHRRALIMLRKLLSES